MLRNDGDRCGDGYGDSWHTWGTHFFFGDGNQCGGGDGDGDGDGYSYGDCDGDGCGYGDRDDYEVAYNQYNDNRYITSLVIDTDPLTTAYQVRTMQTLGDHYAEK